MMLQRAVTQSTRVITSRASSAVITRGYLETGTGRGSQPRAIGCVILGRSLSHSILTAISWHAYPVTRRKLRKVWRFKATLAAPEPEPVLRGSAN